MKDSMACGPHGKHAGGENGCWEMEKRLEFRLPSAFRERRPQGPRALYADYITAFGEGGRPPRLVFLRAFRENPLPAGDLRPNLSGSGAAHVVAGVERTFKAQRRVDVSADHGREALQGVERHLFEAASFFRRAADDASDDVVSRAEGNAATHEVVGEVGGGGVAHFGRMAHCFGLRFDAGHHVAEGAKRVLHGVDGVENGLLVALEVLVVGQGRSLHEGQKAHQVAVDPSRLAARRFGHVRVLFLRHDGRARREAVGELHEAEPLAHPDDELFGETGNVHHDDRRGRAEFDREVAVRYGVERILHGAGEAEKLRRHFAVDRIGGAGERRRAQRRDVEARAEILHAAAVALEHFDVGEKVMAERDGLRDLHVREARHDRVAELVSLRREHFLEVLEAADDFVDLGAEIETDVGRHLIVARATRVKPLAGVADQGREAGLDVEVHVLKLKLPGESAFRDFLLDLRHPVFDRLQVVLGDDARLREHGGVRERSFDVDHRQALVEVEARRVAKHEGVDRFGETAGPGLLFGVKGIVGKIVLRAHR